MAGHISLCRCRVLYLGSSIPLDTAVGIEAIQGPCKDRYDNVDSDNRASGIDSVISVYSSGLLLQYSSDQSSSSWFPIQTLHVCAAVKAVGGNGPLRFVSLDTAAAQRSSGPPIFACIMRRTKGVKVLECHVFVCKSNQAAMALVQSCMHAFGHKEGWSDGSPAPATRIVSAGRSVGSRSRKGGGSIRGGELFSDRMDLIQKFDVSCNVSDKPKEEKSGCNQMVIIQQPGAPAQPEPQPQPMLQQQALIPMNPPGAPVPMVPAGYFADWQMNAGQPLMIIPTSPFYPGDAEMERHKRKKKKKKKKKQADDDSDEETTVFVKKSELLGGRSGGSGGCCGGDSLRSGMRGGHRHGRRGCCEVVEEIIPPSCPPPVVIAPPAPRPCPPNPIVIIPQPPPPPPPQPLPQPNINKEDKSNRDVIVYAPQYIEADKTNTRVDFRKQDRYSFDARPDNRILYENERNYKNDARADNRIKYNAQGYQNADYRQDNRRFDNHEFSQRDFNRIDNRSNRQDNREWNLQDNQWTNREDNRGFNYRADNRTNMQTNHEAYSYGQMVDQGYDGYGMDEQGAFERGYYDAQVEEYNRQLADYEADDGYYPEDYYMAQPGYTDDYGAGFAQYGGAEPQGRYELAYQDDYVLKYPNGQYVDPANGQGYYQ